MTTLLDAHGHAANGADVAGAQGEPPGLAARLDALAELARLGEGRVTETIVDESRELVKRAGERLRLTGGHTVIALAGATGSGKSSLFNAVAGIDLSPVGVRRPTTGDAHACVWGLEGSRPLLEWLGIEKRHRYARATALDADVESALPSGHSAQTGQADQAGHGLVLLDLPDHDSMVRRHRSEVDRLVSVADLVMWVVDPQKYADAAVHKRYLRDSAAHQAVTAVILNQVDVLSPAELDECVTDLRELLTREGLDEPRILATSTRTGAGIPELRSLISETLAQRRVAEERLEADLQRVTSDLAAHGLVLPAARPVELDDACRDAILAELADAAGVSAAARALRHDYWQRGVGLVDWPFLRFARTLRGDPFRRVRLGSEARDELQGSPDFFMPAHGAMVNNALMDIPDALTGPLPDSWLDVVTEAGWSQTADIPAALGEEIGQVATRPVRTPRWWRACAGAQWFLLACVLVGMVWTGCVLAFGVGADTAPRLAFLSAGMLPYALLTVAGALLLGAAIAWVTRRWVSRGADGRWRDTRALMTVRVHDVADRMVFARMREELERYARFCHALQTVRGDRRPSEVDGDPEVQLQISG